MQKITVIPSTINPITSLPTNESVKRRVAGYARVSTDSDEQFTSYEAQVDYYTKYIQSRSDWEFVEVYTDEGISGTNTKRREGFRRMIQNALDGKIDLIVTKSVSRFARNTVDSLVTIRKLKEKGVECYFEKENIYTFDGKGELLITIISSLAQEESRSISENITWGKRFKIAEGKIDVPYKNFLGFKKGEDGKPEIVEEEAEVIRLIYKLFLDGKTSSGIAKQLEMLGILSPSGNKKWYKTTIDSILTNEKYRGDALLQKRFTVNFLEHKLKKNQGEVPQYYVENSHDAIIDPFEWDLVQRELDRRAELGKSYSSKSIFSSKLICEECGGFYGQKLWHSNTKYRRFIWQCNEKFKRDKARCKTPLLETEAIKKMYLIAYNQLMENRNDVVEDCKMIMSTLVDFEKLERQMNEQVQETEVVANLVKSLVKENASTPKSQEEYLSKYEALQLRYNTAVERLEEIKKEYSRRQKQSIAIDAFIKTLEESDLILTDWDDALWNALVEKGIVHQDASITFVFKSGKEIRVEA